MSVLISASFSAGGENPHFLQRDKHPHPPSIPSVGRHPGMLRRVEVLNTAGETNEGKRRLII